MGNDEYCSCKKKNKKKKNMLCIEYWKMELRTYLKTNPYKSYGLVEVFFPISNH